MSNRLQIVINENSKVFRKREIPHFKTFTFEKSFTCCNKKMWFQRQGKNLYKLVTNHAISSSNMNTSLEEKKFILDARFQHIFHLMNNFHLVESKQVSVFPIDSMHSFVLLFNKIILWFSSQMSTWNFHTYVRYMTVES